MRCTTTLFWLKVAKMSSFIFFITTILCFTVISVECTGKIVCYYTTGLANYTTDLPPGLDPTLCTHIIFIGSSIIDGEIKAAKEADIDLYYKKIPQIKKVNPDVKVLLCNGGDFNNVLASEANISRFVNSSLPLLRTYGFDGLDIDFEFPGWNGLPRSQTHAFSLMLQGFYNLFAEEADRTGQPRLMLTAAVAATKEITDVSYEVDVLAKVLDFINLMCYDYHAFAFYDFFTGFNSPMYPEKYDTLLYGNRSIVFSVNYWISKGMPKSKVVVGVPVYGHSYKLLSKYLHGVHALSIGRGDNDGYVTYAQCCENLRSNFTRVFDKNCQVPYMYKDKLWISYDDEESMRIKVKWLKENEFPGMMVYSMKSDDYLGTCDGKTKHPLLRIINEFR